VNLLILYILYYICYINILGTASSCLKEFNPMPFMFCNINGKCTYASRTGNSYWLSTSLDVTMMPVSGRDVSMQHIKTTAINRTLY